MDDEYLIRHLRGWTAESGHEVMLDKVRSDAAERIEQLLADNEHLRTVLAAIESPEILR